MLLFLPPLLLQNLAVALHLALVTMGVGYTLFKPGLSRVPVAVVATMTLVEPLTAWTLGVLLLGDRLSLATGLGIGFILAGLVVLLDSRRPVVTNCASNGRI